MNPLRTLAGRSKIRRAGHIGCGPIPHEFLFEISARHLQGTAILRRQTAAIAVRINLRIDGNNELCAGASHTGLRLRWTCSVCAAAGARQPDGCRKYRG
jgi:hypothetical protein